MERVTTFNLSTVQEMNEDELFEHGKCPICMSGMNSLESKAWFCTNCLTEFTKKGEALEPIF